MPERRVVAALAIALVRVAAARANETLSAAAPDLL